MRNILLIGGTLIFILASLVLLNSISATTRDEMPDLESFPNRSTYNIGATGYSVFYSFLNSSSVTVSRWEEPFEKLNKSLNIENPQTLVIVGRVRKRITDDEIKHLLEWVNSGGRLVLIDREPYTQLQKVFEKKGLTILPDWSLHGFDPLDRYSMIGNTPAAKPVQPVPYLLGINAVQTSKLFASVNYYSTQDHVNPQDDSPDNSSDDEILGIKENLDMSAYGMSERMILMKTDTHGVFAEVKFGYGRIYFIGDPYIFSNAGISLADNARFGRMFLASLPKPLMFDEYHQGFAKGNKTIVSYFSNTPAIAIFFQVCVLAFVFVYSKSRRFSRPLPLKDKQRSAKTEYLAAMAGLSAKMGAYEIAIENIYGEFKKRMSRHFGKEVFLSPSAAAKIIAARLNESPDKLYNIFLRCEEILNGGKCSAKEALGLAAELRRLEKSL
ncbi:MAG TPA: DUF4350 domain-containing protein [Pyrinomonadaceae bacterium]|jgi:hypothetical protein|nr:DUF4350 domain-containing protein [Pyrinomonadaceae bacterium]